MRWARVLHRAGIVRLRSLVCYLPLLSLACAGGEGPPLPDAGAAADSGSSATDAGHSSSDAGPGAVDADSLDSGALLDAEGPDAEAPDAELGDGGGAPCRGLPGTFHDQQLLSGGERRGYFLHVPADYRCEDAWPLLIDFHGTAGGPAAEEAYHTDALIETADRERFIALRPRSRSSLEGGSEVFRWDQNPGDLARNTAFARELLAELERNYHVDPRRIYASGFSSGTNMIAQLAAADLPFAGFGFVAGGYWNDPGALTASSLSARYYLATGYRDYLHDSQRALWGKLERQGVPAERIFRRETDGGHELYGWHFPELWAWLDRGERPQAGRLSAGWAQTATVAGGTLLALVPTSSGAFLASNARGEVHLRSALGQWSRTGGLGREQPLVALAALPSRRALAVGDGAVLESDDGGTSWRAGAAVPEFFGTYFGVAKVGALATSGRDRILAGGAWCGALSDSGGRRWSGSQMFYPGTSVPAQIGGIAIGTASVAIAAGYYYLGRSTDGRSFTALIAPRDNGWLNDVAYAAPSDWWTVGDDGAIFHSADDGRTWIDQSPLGEHRSFYAVDFQDPAVGLAVGLGGAAYETTDGGQSWHDVSTGVDRMLGAVRMLGDGRALVVGEGGAVLERTVGP